MKWPQSLTLIRHATSQYNQMKKDLDKDPLHQEFVRLFEADPTSSVCIAHAILLIEKYALKCSDFDTPLDDAGFEMARITSHNLKKMVTKPDVVFVSPYLRTMQTFEVLKEGCPDLRGIPVVEEERIREQEHGLAGLYNNWRAFHVMNPDQKKLFDMMGPYWYQYPQGESVPILRERNRSWITTLIREYAGKRVLAITHHLTILACRAQLERFGSREFIRLDHEEKPLNCGVTIYKGDHSQGKNGKLVLQTYNAKLY